MDAETLRQVTAHDLAVIRGPYVGIGLVILAVLVVIALTKMPRTENHGDGLDVGPTLKRLLANRRYVEGVVAQFFYVGAQIMCWTFIIHYGTELFMARGMAEQDAEALSQGYNIVAMVIFCLSRFICTFLLRYISPGRLLMSLAIGGLALSLGTIFLPGLGGLYALVGISACMSLMFPTIYGIALRGLGEDAKFGAAGLIMAILGGSVLPPLQGAITDLGRVGSLSAVRASFVLPLVCFVVIAAYGFRAYRDRTSTVS
jgi:FHS family L-fucose permease-like MFS transporter